MDRAEAQDRILEIDAQLSELGTRLLNQNLKAQRLYGQRDILVEQLEGKSDDTVDKESVQDPEESERSSESD